MGAFPYAPGQAHSAHLAPPVHPHPSLLPSREKGSGSPYARPAAPVHPHANPLPSRERGSGSPSALTHSREMLRLRCAPLSMTGMPTPHRRGCEVPASAGTTEVQGCEVPAFAGTTSKWAHFPALPVRPTQPASPRRFTLTLTLSPRGRGNQAVPYPAPPRVRGRGRPRRCTRCRVRRWAWAGRVRCARRAPTCPPLPWRSASRRSRLPCSSPYGR